MTAYQLGHAALHAMDHLHCLRALIADGQLLNMYTPYPLVRAALENASTAVWLLAPASRTERIIRRLRLAALDLRSADKSGHGDRQPDDPRRCPTGSTR
jgi:hypothetical protein